MFRRLWHHFRPGDVMVYDRACCSYVDIILLAQRGVFCAFRLHPRCQFPARTITPALE